MGQTDWLDACVGMDSRLISRISRPLPLRLDDIKARTWQEVIFVLECSGNHGLPFFNSGIGNTDFQDSQDLGFGRLGVPDLSLVFPGFAPLR